MLLLLLASLLSLLSLSHYGHYDDYNDHDDFDNYENIKSELTILSVDESLKLIKQNLKKLKSGQLKKLNISINNS